MGVGIDLGTGVVEVRICVASLILRVGEFGLLDNTMWSLLKPVVRVSSYTNQGVHFPRHELRKKQVDLQRTVLGHGGHRLGQTISQQSILLLQLLIPLHRLHQLRVRIAGIGEFLDLPLQCIDMVLGSLSDGSLRFSVIRSLPLELRRRQG